VPIARLSVVYSTDGTRFPFSFPRYRITLFHRLSAAIAPVSKTGMGLSVHRGSNPPFSADLGRFPGVSWRNGRLQAGMDGFEDGSAQANLGPISRHPVPPAVPLQWPPRGTERLSRGRWLPAEARGSRLVRPELVKAAPTQVIRT
jgi:hypothetical protein